MHATNVHGVRFHHNGDYSGAVWVEISGNVIIRRVGLTRHVEIPFAAIKQLVADYVGGRRISQLEQASADEVLGLGPGESES